MRQHARILVAIAAAVAACGCSTNNNATSRLRLVGGERFEFVGVDPAAVTALEGRWGDVFAVRVATASADVPPMLGTYVLSGDTLWFTPRFPLAAGVRYRATVDGSRPTLSPHPYGDRESGAIW